MNREIKMILMDRVFRNGWALAWFGFVLSFIMCGILFRQHSLLWMIASLSGLLFAAMAYEFGAAGRVYVQLPVGTENLARSGICSIAAMAAFLFLPMSVLALIYESATDIEVSNPIRMALCAGSAGISMACLFLGIRIRLQRILGAFLPRIYPWLRQPVRDAAIWLWLGGPFMAGGWLLWLCGEPGSIETVVLLLLAAALMAILWKFLPDSSFLPGKANRSFISERTKSGEVLRLPPGSSRWPIELHFWFRWELVMIPVAASLIWLFFHKPYPQLKELDPRHFNFGLLALCIFAMPSHSDRKGALQKSMRVYRSLPMSAGRLTWYFCADSILAVTVLGSALLLSQLSAADWCLAVAAMSFGFCNGLGWIGYRAGQGNIPSIWALFVVFAIVAGLCISYLPGIGLLPYIAFACFTLIAAFVSPFMLARSLANCDLPRAVRGRDDD